MSNRYHFFYKGGFGANVKRKVEPVNWRWLLDYISLEGNEFCKICICVPWYMYPSFKIMVLGANHPFTLDSVNQEHHVQYLTA